MGALIATASSARPTRNSAQEPVRAQIRVPTANAAPDTSIISRLPHRSDIFPKSGVVAPPTRPKMMTIQLMLAPTPGKEGAMSRAAAATIVYWSAAISAKRTTTKITPKIRSRDAFSSTAGGGGGGGGASDAGDVGTWAEDTCGSSVLGTRRAQGGHPQVII